MYNELIQTRLNFTSNFVDENNPKSKCQCTNELNGRLQELKNKGKVQLGNLKSGRDRLREVFITKFKSPFKRGFHKGGRKQSWSLTRVVARIALMKIWTSDQVDWILAKYFFAFLSTEKKSRSTKTQIRKANIQQCGKSLARKIDPGEGGGILPCHQLIGMRCRMGLHFHDWIDYNGALFSLELPEWDHTFSGLRGIRKFRQVGI